MVISLENPKKFNFFSKDQLLEIGIDKKDLENIEETYQGYVKKTVIKYFCQKTNKPETEYIQIFSFSSFLGLDVGKIMDLKKGNQNIVVNRGEGEFEDIYISTEDIPFILKKFGLEETVNNEIENNLTINKIKPTEQEVEFEIGKIRAKKIKLEEYKLRRKEPNPENIEEELIVSDDEVSYEKKFDSRLFHQIVNDQIDLTSVCGGIYESVLKEIFEKSKQMRGVQEFQLSEYEIEFLARMTFFEIKNIDQNYINLSEPLKRKKLENQALDTILEYTEILDGNFRQQDTYER